MFSFCILYCSKVDKTTMLSILPIVEGMPLIVLGQEVPTKLFFNCGMSSLHSACQLLVMTFYVCSSCFFSSCSRGTLEPVNGGRPKKSVIRSISYLHSIGYSAIVLYSSIFYLFEKFLPPVSISATFPIRFYLNLSYPSMIFTIRLFLLTEKS